MTGFSGGANVTNEVMALGVIGVLLLACLMWIGASALRAARHIMGVRRRYSWLIQKHATLERDLTTVRHSIRQEQIALVKAEEALLAKQQEVAAAEERLRITRTTCVRVYDVLIERYADKDRLWLLADGKNGAAGRWAVAAPDVKTATEMVMKKNSAVGKLAQEGQM